MEFVEPTELPTANVLLYGKPKHGKTIGAATAPKPILLLNADLHNASRQVHLRNPGTVKEVKLPEFVEGRFDQYLKLMAEICNVCADPNTEYKTVVVDKIGDLHKRMLEELSQRKVRPHLNSYGDVSVHIERFCKYLCEIQHINVVLVCGEYAQKDESTGEMTLGPFTGTAQGSAVLGTKLQEMVDIIGYCDVSLKEDGVPEYGAQLIPGKGRTGGDRFNVLGAYQPLDLENWFKLILAAEEEERKAKATDKSKVATLPQAKAGGK